MIKQTKGITLIALVITIIVLLILAGVTIATLTGDNGLLQKSSGAENTTIEAEGLERIKLAVMASHDKNGIDTTSLAKSLSRINNLTDTNNQAIEESTDEKVDSEDEEANE
jgi:flagellar basal body-associated protein FliL